MESRGSDKFRRAKNQWRRRGGRRDHRPNRINPPGVVGPVQWRSSWPASSSRLRSVSWCCAPSCGRCSWSCTTTPGRYPIGSVMTREDRCREVWRRGGGVADTVGSLMVSTRGGLVPRPSRLNQRVGRVVSTRGRLAALAGRGSTSGWGGWFRRAADSLRSPVAAQPAGGVGGFDARPTRCARRSRLNQRVERRPGV